MMPVTRILTSAGESSLNRKSLLRDNPLAPYFIRRETMCIRRLSAQTYPHHLRK
jgi:hypothetical protein